MTIKPFREKPVAILNVKRTEGQYDGIHVCNGVSLDLTPTEPGSVSDLCHASYRTTGVRLGPASLKYDARESEVP